MLLQNPQLARDAGDTSGLATLEEADLPLLLELLAYLRKNPAASMGGILGYWYGTPEGELLNRLAAADPVPGHHAEQEFQDILRHLSSRVVSNQSEDRRRALESIPFTEMSPEQKQEYMSLLRARPR